MTESTLTSQPPARGFGVSDFIFANACVSISVEVQGVLNQHPEGPLFTLILKQSN